MICDVHLPNGKIGTYVVPFAFDGMTKDGVFGVGYVKNRDPETGLTTIVNAEKGQTFVMDDEYINTYGI